MSRVLCIPDTHIPFHHPDGLDFCKKVYKQYKCDTVIFTGDVLDQYCFSRYPKNPLLPNAVDEWKNSIKGLKGWIKAFPTANMILGNHDLRLFKRISDAGIPAYFMKSVHELLELPDTWQVAEEFECDGVLYVHGEGLNDDPRAAIKKVGQSVVYGHTHKAGIAHYACRLDRKFAMNNGCLVDLKALAFEYSKSMHQKAMLGVGVVIDGDTPIFIPLPLENKLTRKREEK